MYAGYIYLSLRNHRAGGGFESSPFTKKEVATYGLRLPDEYVELKVLAFIEDVLRKRFLSFPSAKVGERYCITWELRNFVCE